MASRSPTAATPLPKSSVAPETPLARETTPQPVAFPPPQTFDIVPPLHGLLLRLLPSHTNAGGVSNGVRPADDPGTAAAPSGPSSTTVNSNQSQLQQHQQNGPGGENNHGGLQTVSSGSASAAAEISALGSNAHPSLDIKGLPTEVSSIKIRIQKAQAVVEGLPDVQRSVDEQEEEIEELEDRITRLKSVIADFGKRAAPQPTGKSRLQVS
ncbi:hypothetical protein EYZ11_001942 [Aspergillus tanneri]|uniref:Mediator of RNA polymerase II transcription subunit 9 n=1 Tax=Aspergillus tanneri TaxID=1220188 RepID=A0A4S3JST6_9EURO|nr:uncharacterized protein ATNIH1004_007475 [Aspergillus tanneri]KAA8646052.1 hypothetical protein ATNIH1004_007475 [Aspergillus tanneri]THC98590.1 hypothetical protein EYZ11_001942 [Aspergillus tanneri]